MGVAVRLAETRLPGGVDGDQPGEPALRHRGGERVRSDARIDQRSVGGAPHELDAAGHDAEHRDRRRQVVAVDESGTLRASSSMSLLRTKARRPSRSHWTTAPPTNTLPSSA